MRHLSLVRCFLLCFMTAVACKQPSGTIQSSSTDIKSIKTESSLPQHMPKCEPRDQKVSVNPYLEPVTDCSSSYYKLFEDINKKNSERRDTLNDKILSEFKQVFQKNNLELLLPSTYTYKDLTDNMTNIAKKLLVELKVSTREEIGEFAYNRLYLGQKDSTTIQFFFSGEPEPVFGLSKNKITEVKLLKTANNLDKILYGSYILCGPEPALEGACIISPEENFNKTKFYLYILPNNTSSYEIATEPILIQNRGFIYDIKFSYQVTPSHVAALPFTSNTVLGHIKLVDLENIVPKANYNLR